MVDLGYGKWAFELSLCQERIKRVMFMEDSLKRIVSIFSCGADQVNAPAMAPSSMRFPESV